MQGTSVVRSFIQQQSGNGLWREYDHLLKRIRCTKDEEYGSFFSGGGGNERDSPIFACKFASKQGYENILALANEDGKLIVHDTDNKIPWQGGQVHQNAIFDLAWLAKSYKLVTVSGDHSARLVDMHSMHVEQIFDVHSRSVKTVASQTEDPSIFATGSRDGCIGLWDIRASQTNGPVIVVADRVIQNSHFSTTPRSGARRRAPSACRVTAANSVTGLVFQDRDTLISCGSGDGHIKFWDLRKTYATSKDPVAKCTIPYSGKTAKNGFSNLEVDPSGLRLFANCLDNTIYCYNIGAYNITPVMEYRGHQNHTFFVKSVISPDGQYLLSGSSDHNAYIWNVKSSEPVVKLTGHTAEVTCVAWRKNSNLTIVTCSDDVLHKVWRAGPELLPDNWEVEGCGTAEPLVRTPRAVKKCSEWNENTPCSLWKRFKMTPSNKRPLDDIDEESSASKRFSSNRRLFEITNNLPTCSRDEDTLATVLERTPTSRIEHESPETFSPTTNLPNFAIDGCAPHLHFSPQKRLDRDWLTKMRVEKSLFRDMQDHANEGCSSPKVPRLEISSPRSRSNKKPNRPGRSGSPQSHLLQYFRITNKSIMKDSICAPRSSINSPQHPLEKQNE